MGALAALETDVHGDVDREDLADFAPRIAALQPYLAERLQEELKRPVSLESFLHVLGSLSKPFTFLRSTWNNPFEEDWRNQEDSQTDWGWDWGGMRLIVRQKRSSVQDELNWTAGEGTTAAEDEPPLKKACQ